MELHYSLVGLENKGQNNCFINVVIQILWHMSEIRNQFINESHTHDKNALCITCEIIVIFK